jgi:hypothetical protein
LQAVPVLGGAEVWAKADAQPGRASKRAAARVKRFIGMRRMGVCFVF